MSVIFLFTQISNRHLSQQKLEPRQGRTRDIYRYTVAILIGKVYHHSDLPSYVMTEQTIQDRAVRLTAWVGLTICSIVCLCAITSQTNERTSSEKWVVAVTSISMCFSFLAVVAYFVARDKFAGVMPEGAVAILLLAFWCAGLPVIMNPSQSIAVTTTISTVSGFTFVYSANLYFATWAAFFTIIFICGSFVQDSLVVAQTQFSSITPKIGT